MKPTKRNYLFDNLKVLLIFLVVVGHSLEKYIDNSLALRSIYFFIFMFHMPLFIYVSGYFSKTIGSYRKNAIKDLLLPFILFNIIWYISVGDFTFPLYYAGWTLWYLISLFFWRFFLKDIIKVKYILLLSIILGLIVGFSNKYMDFLSFSRTIAFLPFFLLGYYSNSSTINKIKKYSKAKSILGLITFVVLAFLITKYGNINYKFLYMSESYTSSGFGMLQGIILRALFYVFAILVSVFIINLVSSKKLNLSKIGGATLIIYLGHIYLIRFFSTLIPAFISPLLNLCIIIISSFLICWVLSLPILFHVYKYVSAKINHSIHNIMRRIRKLNPL